MYTFQASVRDIFLGGCSKGVNWASMVSVGVGVRERDLGVVRD